MSEYLLRQLEEERHKLNELGAHSLDQHIALAHNQFVQEQSRKVDELIIRYTLKKEKARDAGQ
ncbi:MAG: aspartyl-phosphate phosphatase Spo0E family protein [Gorillibacterium sp.]|nr:aspartyl-phosphate phosphatase Spo0E family protein [Gorillibacterium sp.]